MLKTSHIKNFIAKPAKFLITISILVLAGTFTPIHNAQAACTYIVNPTTVAFYGPKGQPIDCGAFAQKVDKALQKGADAIVGGLTSMLLTPLVWIAQLFFKISNLFMEMMGTLLDISIQSTISSGIYKQVSAIQVGWAAVRDMTNMFFIFVLLYIAILTVVGSAGASAKRWVANLIIAAVMINFSLFITQVVIDSGNILALGFWNKMTVVEGGTTNSSATAFFLEGFRLQTEFDTMNDKGIPIDKSKQIIIYLGGALVSFVAGYIFLAGAVMMIVRSVTLMILMIASPFAFLGFALPKGGGFAQTWLNRLIGSTFVAPAFIFMLYIDALIIRGAELIQGSGADKSKFALAFAGDVSSFPIIYNFILMIILLLASLTVANQVSSGAGNTAGAWAKKSLGAGGVAVVVGGAYGARQSLGRVGRMTSESTALRTAAERGGFRGGVAKMALNAGNSLQKSSFDLRNSKAFSATAGAGLKKAGINLGSTGQKVGKGGFESTGSIEGKALSSVGLSGIAGGVGYIGTERQKAIKEKAESMIKDGSKPEDIEKYIVKRAGATGTKKRRILKGYENDQNGKPDYTKPKFEIVGNNKISGYQHPAFSNIKANLAVKKAAKIVEDHTALADDASKRNDSTAVFQNAIKAQRAAESITNGGVSNRVANAKKKEKSDDQKLVEAIKAAAAATNPVA